MKTIYRLHFPDDAIGQNEAFYSSCAAQGLHLVKRGVYFSRFVSGPPRKDLYRILIAPSCPNDGSQPANSCFAPGEEANPNYISSHGLLHIFQRIVRFLCSMPHRSSKSLHSGFYRNIRFGNV